MKWSDIAGVVGGAAPLIGTILGGPAGGVVGKVVANVLGVEDTPDAVGKAIAADPQAMAKLRAAELEHKADLQRMTLAHAASTIESVNRTMRVEATSDRWWVSGWRPMWGILSAVAFFCQALAIAWLLVSGGDAGLVASLASLSVFWGVPLAICGVTAYGRSKEKIARTTGMAEPTLLGALAGRLGAGAKG